MTTTITTITAEQVAELRPLAELFRWARSCGWTRNDRGAWQNAFDREDATVKVDFDTVCVDVWRKDNGHWPTWSTPYPVDNARQGINVLAALDIIPAEFFVGAKTQRCESCGPGYDCERGIYTPAVAR